MSAETPEAAARRLAAAVLNDGYKPEALHVYQDADGQPMFYRIRCTHPDGRKWMRPMMLNGTGFKVGEPPAPADGKPLYRLPQLLADPSSSVWIVEGEKCADSLAKLGLTCTTSGSASSADVADWSPLQGRSVRVWPDNDEAGAKYAEAVSLKLRALGCTVRVLAREVVEALPVHGDCVDWLLAHPEATAGDVRALATVHASGATSAPDPLIAQHGHEPYPLDALPDAIRVAVTEVQAFVQAPVPLVASAALGALSLAAQSLADVTRAERLYGPCGLFLLTIADSGERKTTCDGYFSTAIRDFEQEQAEVAKPALRQYRADAHAWESRQAGLKDALRQAARKGTETTPIEAALRDVENEKPIAPRVPKLMRGDETPEHLAWLLAKEWPSGGVMSSEAGTVLGSHGMGRDTIMRNLSQLNVLWDGGKLSIGRRTSESFDVNGARLTVALQVQEATLRAFFERSGGLARGTGFLARFLIAWPASTQGNRPFREAPTHWPSLSAFNRRIGVLLRQAQPLTEDYTLAPAALSFSPEAKAAWVAFHDAIEAELRVGGELADVRDVASKCADNAARLAALFHVFSGGAGAIGADHFERASRIAAWHLNESRRFFGELALPDDLADAVRLERFLLGYCEAHHVQSVARRHVQQSGPIRDGERLDAALDILTRARRATLTLDRRQKLIEVHPSLLTGGAG